MGIVTAGHTIHMLGSNAKKISWSTLASIICVFSIAAGACYGLGLRGGLEWLLPAFLCSLVLLLIEARRKRIQIKKMALWTLCGVVFVLLHAAMVILNNQAWDRSNSKITAYGISKK